MVQVSLNGLLGCSSLSFGEEGVWVQAHAGMDRMDEIRVLQLEEMAQSPKLS